MKKSNASRILDKLKIPHEILEYEADETDLSAENAAQKMGQPLKQVFKTLVIRGDKTGILAACIPGGAELNLKTLASISGNKKVEMVHLKELKSLTGYIRGGVSPLAMKKNYPVYIDESAFQFLFIIFSAGVRGLQLKVDPNDLSKAMQFIPGQLTVT
jgi:Cys-tRNA(Pro)/Cys-tRNA(Cys) deacylase